MRVSQILSLAVHTAILRPIAKVWPKKPGSVAFMPREGNRYIDNVAHFYEVLRRRGLLSESAYLVVPRSPKVARGWRAKGRNVLSLKTERVRGMRRLLETETVVADSWQWIENNRYNWLAGARKVQIWHGIPLKKIELSNLDEKRTPTRSSRVINWMRGRYPRYDLLVSTSGFFEREAFGKSFRAERIVNTGYPRNDLFFAEPGEEAQVDGDVLTLQTLETLKAEGKRIVVYAPTFRDSGGTPFEDSALRLLELVRFARAQNIVFVLKLHPYVNVAPNTAVWPDVIMYDASKDSGPLLKLAHLLITDYSSVYFDYLLLDRPVLFFPYDYEKYFRHDRGFLFDYDEYTPGRKCFTQEELFAALTDELDSPDEEFVRQRAALKEKSFDYADGEASLRLWDEICSLGRS